MSTPRRIASLFRELADAFDRLEDERQRKPRKRRARIAAEAPEDENVDPAVEAQVRNGLRRAGARV